MKITELLTEDDILLHNEPVNLWEMANISTNKTGLNVIIWVSSGESSKHAPRIKICSGKKWNSDECSTIPIHGLPRIIGNAKVTQSQFSEIIKWIKLNKRLIIQYWNSEITTDEMLNNISSI